MEHVELRIGAPVGVASLAIWPIAAKVAIVGVIGIEPGDLVTENHLCHVRGSNREGMAA